MHSERTAPDRAPPRLLLFIRDPYPTNRPDIVELFGQMARRGVRTDLVASRRSDGMPVTEEWTLGEALVHEARGGGVRRALGGLWHDLACLRRARGHDAVVVRDKIVFAALALLLSRVPVFYWASFPFPEEDRLRAAQALRGPVHAAALCVRAFVGERLLYSWVVRRARGVFVQSERMREQFEARSGRHDGLVPVPMGVAPSALIATTPPRTPSASSGATFELVYLGALDRVRHIDFLLDVLAENRRRQPDVDYRLCLVGAASTAPEDDWLRDQIEARGLSPFVDRVGPLPREQAWTRARRAQLGVSAIPRGPVFDVSSPTKTVEYLTLGLPVVVNDIPDQAAVVAATGAGLCVPMAVDEFAQAIVQARERHAELQERAGAARDWLLAHRGYDVLATRVDRALREALRGGRRD